MDKIQDDYKISASVTVCLGLGSNLGDRERLMARAIELLSQSLGSPLRVSTAIETEPLGFTSPNPFLNMVALFSTNIPPLELLSVTEEVERRLGRTVKTRQGCSYSDRPMDIDILLYGDRVIHSERLTLPHPRMHERAFVLIPLAEVAPGIVHPVLGKSIEELKNRLSD